MGDVVNAQGLFNRMRMWLAGVTFHGRRDMYELFGWDRYVDYRNFIAAYYRQSLAKRVIDAPVLGTWTDPPQLMAQQEFLDAWDDIVENHNLWAHIVRLDKLAGLGRFAVMVVGFDDGQDLDTPISLGRDGISRRKREVIYLQPYHEGAITIIEYEQDTKSPRFGKPVMYSINPGRFIVEGLTSTSQASVIAPSLRTPFRCHYSRIIHVAENLLEDSIFGSSRLEVVYNDLSDVLKVTGSSAESFWMIANRGMQVDVDKEIDLAPEDAAQLQQEVEDYQHQLRRFIRTRGVTITPLGAEKVDPQALYMVLLSLIATATGIPQAILQGSSPRILAAKTDRASWADRLQERQSEYAEPIILRRVLDCFVNAGAVPVPENLEISWPETFKMDPLERAQTSAQMARSAVNLTKAWVFAAPKDPLTGEPLETQPLFTADEMRRMVSFGRHPPIFDSPAPAAKPTPAPPTADQAPSATPVKPPTDKPGAPAPNTPPKRPPNPEPPTNG